MIFLPKEKSLARDWFVRMCARSVHANRICYGANEHVNSLFNHYFVLFSSQSVYTNGQNNFFKLTLITSNTKKKRNKIKTPATTTFTHNQMLTMLFWCFACWMLHVLLNKYKNTPSTTHMNTNIVVCVPVVYVRVRRNANVAQRSVCLCVCVFECIRLFCCYCVSHTFCWILCIELSKFVVFIECDRLFFWLFFLLEFFCSY